MHGTGANAVERHGITVRDMSSRRRLLDARSLRPRDYLVDPYQYGSHPDPHWRLPRAGDRRSLQVAMVEHHVALLVRTYGGRHLATEVGRRFGFTKSYWSDCLQGRAWMGETVLAAAVAATWPTHSGSQ